MRAAHDYLLHGPGGATRAQRPHGRFDDLRGGRSLAFIANMGELVAMHPEDVAPVLSEVDHQTFKGRWVFGFVAYEAAAGLDHALPVHPPRAGLPLAWFGICDEPASLGALPSLPRNAFRVGPWCMESESDVYTQRVEAVRERIAAGDAYQCNLTTRINGPASGDMLGLYAEMARRQLGAHNAYLDIGRYAVVSASPELFFESGQGRIRMRPMKGTARRGSIPGEDAAIAATLRGSAKECAENVMIVDLIRNDLSRLAKTGTVKVASLLQLETYATVHQLTSEIRAELAHDVGVSRIFSSLFPCGSVTGAPKRAAMGIIGELEPNPRGAYCGAMGFVAPAGSAIGARFNVAIRTALVDKHADTATYGTGGAITWDSTPEAEYRELLAKGEVLTGIRCE